MIFVKLTVAIFVTFCFLSDVPVVADEKTDNNDEADNILVV